MVVVSMHMLSDPECIISMYKDVAMHKNVTGAMLYTPCERM